MFLKQAHHWFQRTWEDCFLYQQGWVIKWTNLSLIGTLFIDRESLFARLHWEQVFIQSCACTNIPTFITSPILSIIECYQHVLYAHIYIYHLSILLDIQSHFRIGLVNHSGFRPRPWLPGVPVKPLAGWLRPSRAGSWRQRWVIKQITSDYHLGSGKLFHIYIYVYIYICDIYVFIFFITNWLCCN